MKRLWLSLLAVLFATCAMCPLPCARCSAPKGEPVQVIATAYSAHDPGLSSHTATGTLVRHGVIAVDPDFIPLGSLVYIPDYGNAAAEDVGGGVRGNIIDIAFDTHEEAMAFGRRSLTIYVLRWGY